MRQKSSPVSSAGTPSKYDVVRAANAAAPKPKTAAQSEPSSSRLHGGAWRATMSRPSLHAPLISLPTTTLCFFTPLLSFSSSRRRSRRSLRRQLPIPSPSDSRTGKLPISDADEAQETLRLTLDFPYLDSKARALVSSAREAYLDLRTLVSTDENGRLVVSCKRGTLKFAGGVLVVGVVSLFVVRALVRLVTGLGMWFRRMNEGSGEVLVVRRDRSLGGREVVVAKREARARVLENPVSDGVDSGKSAVSELRRLSRLERQGSEKLPGWWPKKLGEDHGDVEELEVDKEIFRREANRLVRGRW